MLATLAVKGRGPKTGYSREQFGAAWADVDRNGCDTRDDILNRDLGGEGVAAGHARVRRGRRRAARPVHRPAARVRQGPREAVQIDHVVALSDAWQKGAAQWDAARRLAFANDPLNLLAVDGPTNLRRATATPRRGSRRSGRTGVGSSPGRSR